jgi:hypothetical protein
MMASSAPSIAKIRRLKIEEDGDPWRGNTKPKIRLKGNWLARAGFRHGQRVEVKFVTEGVIELRVTAKENPSAASPSHSTTQ